MKAKDDVRLPQKGFTVAPIIYTPNFFPAPDVTFAKLWDELTWERRESTPRREYYSNDFPVPYTYGVGRGVRTYLPQPYHAEVTKIREAIEKITGTVFEVCFLNGYANQSDHLGWHADDSPEMDDARPIAIVSLGAEREIWFRKNPLLVETGADNPIDKIKLEHGSLCLMLPEMQDTHQHRIPKAGNICGSRVSLTFRGYVQNA